MYDSHNFAGRQLSKYERRVAGLRDSAPPSPIKVFNSAGELLRIEEPTERPYKFNNRRPYIDPEVAGE